MIYFLWQMLTSSILKVMVKKVKRELKVFIKMQNKKSVLVWFLKALSYNLKWFFFSFDFLTSELMQDLF